MVEQSPETPRPILNILFAPELDEAIVGKTIHLDLSRRTLPRRLLRWLLDNPDWGIPQDRLEEQVNLAKVKAKDPIPAVLRFMNKLLDPQGIYKDEEIVALVDEPEGLVCKLRANVERVVYSPVQKGSCANGRKPCSPTRSKKLLLQKGKSSQRQVSAEIRVLGLSQSDIEEIAAHYPTSLSKPCI